MSVSMVDVDIQLYIGSLLKSDQKHVWQKLWSQIDLPF